MGSAVPARSLDRAREYWRQHGRSAKWIQQRMMGQETRNKLTDYWKDHEIKGEDEYTRASAWQASRFRKGRWPNMKKTLAAWAVASIFLLGGCASTQVEFTGAALKAPLCQTGAPPVATAFYWGPQWRPDQKEPDLREAAALRGIQAFLGQTSCIVLTDIRRWSIGDPLPSDAELLRLAAGSSPVPERVVFVLVRELGPRLEIGIPVIVQGGTEVLIEVRVLDTHSATLLAATRTLWRNGGTFVIKGVKTLDKDMSAALAATLMPDAVAR